MMAFFGSSSFPSVSLLTVIVTFCWLILRLADAIFNEGRIEIIESRRWIFDPIVANKIMLWYPCAYTYYRKEHRIHAVCLACSAFASFLFHLSREQRFLWLDRPLAHLAFFTTFPEILRFLSQARRNDVSEKMFLGLSIMLSFHFLAKAREGADFWVNHCMWHVMIISGQWLLSSRIPTPRGTPSADTILVATSSLPTCSPCQASEGASAKLDPSSTIQRSSSGSLVRCRSADSVAGFSTRSGSLGLGQYV
mmetsp:Transcript_15009/g.20063  ORF Transcript_15009/g.20063 Transcript_15009/m.20063 type:complete len:251 (+) Transcript_15009:31-783(+)